MDASVMAAPLLWHFEIRRNLGTAGCRVPSLKVTRAMSCSI